MVEKILLQKNNWEVGGSVNDPVIVNIDNGKTIDITIIDFSSSSSGRLKIYYLYDGENISNPFSGIENDVSPFIVAVVNNGDSFKKYPSGIFRIVGNDNNKLKIVCKNLEIKPRRFDVTIIEDEI